MRINVKWGKTHPMVMDEEILENRKFQLALHNSTFFQSVVTTIASMMFVSFISFFIASFESRNELGVKDFFFTLVKLYGGGAIMLFLVLYTVGFKIIKIIEKKYISPLIRESDRMGNVEVKDHIESNSSHDQNKLRCVIETPEKRIVEDDAYNVRYLIENLSEVDFSGGKLDCRLIRSALGDRHSVKHIYKNIGLIKAGEVKPLNPKEIKAISGPNIFVFMEFTPIDTIKKFIMVGTEGKELAKGDYMHYLRVRSIEEISSMNNLRIASYSLIILIGAQLFDWIFQLWINDIICSQNLIFSLLTIPSLIALIIYLIHVRFK